MHAAVGQNGREISREGHKHTNCFEYTSTHRDPSRCNGYTTPKVVHLYPRHSSVHAKGAAAAVYL